MLAFVVAAAAPRSFVASARQIAPQRVQLSDPAGCERVLAAAALAGPGAADLQLVLPGELAQLPAASNASLGARAALAAAPLPFAPGELTARLRTLPTRDRPCLLEVAVPQVASPQAYCEVRIEQAGKEELLRRVPLDGEVHALEFTPTRTGAHALHCRAVLGDVQVAAAGRFDVVDPGTVLVLESGELLAAALRAQGVQVEATEVPPSDWSKFAAVVLAVPLAAAAQPALVHAVEDGLGLFVIEPAFGEDGEPLREVLPLRPAPRVDAGPPAEEPGNEAAPAEPPPPPPPTPPVGDTKDAGPVGDEPVEIDKRLVALALVVDRSGSMGNTLANGRTKMSYAKTSALRTAAALGPGDEVVIVTFGNKGAGRVELPLTDASDAELVRAGATKLAHAAEQTFLLSGVQLAAAALRRSKAVVRHIVVISDGEFQLSESFALRSLANQLSTREHMSLSVIAIVDAFTLPEFRREAEELTRDGGGRFLPIQDAELVPTFVTAEVTHSLAAAGRQPRSGDDPNLPSTAPETPPQPPVEPPKPPPKPPAELPRGSTALAVVAVADSPLLRPEPSPSWPKLAAARAGDAPLQAEVLLAAGDAGWPLLAFNNHALGRVGAFAADLGGEPCREFRRDLAFPGRLAQWVQHTIAPPAEPPGANLLQAPVVSPRVPLPSEVAALQALAGAAVEPLPELSAAPRQLQVRGGSAVVPDWLLLLLLVVLAAVERFTARLA